MMDFEGNASGRVNDLSASVPVTPRSHTTHPVAMSTPAASIFTAAHRSDFFHDAHASAESIYSAIHKAESKSTFDPIYCYNDVTGEVANEVKEMQSELFPNLPRRAGGPVEHWTFQFYTQGLRLSHVKALKQQSTAARECLAAHSKAPDVAKAFIRHVQASPNPPLVNPDVHRLQPWQEEVFGALKHYEQHSARLAEPIEHCERTLNVIEAAFASVLPRRDLSYATKIARTLCTCSTDFTEDEIRNIVETVPSASRNTPAAWLEGIFGDGRANVLAMF